jgi:hypothetical protein
MNRIAGIETEYGCLVSGEQAASLDAWPARVKNHVFRRMKAGAIDLHYRDYEEPPGNGGFLRNGGRLYMDMGHLEYSSPECRTVRDAVAYECAGDLLLQSALGEMGAGESVSFIKNNVDHHTGATFGCHENYLMRRDVQFHPALLGTLLSFLATRQIFTGAGRVGQASPLAFDFDPPRGGAGPVEFQISQRADHIVNDIYQWVQFNRAIINARDEPLADYRKYRRLHLLIGDSNMAPFACALKIGTTALILDLLEQGRLPDDVILRDPVIATRQISHDCTPHASVQLDDGASRTALEIQWEFHRAAQQALAGSDDETDWLLERWGFTLDALATLDSRPELLLGGVDWITKKWMLERFRSEEGLAWDDPWLQSLDLEYHNIDPNRGLFFGVVPSKAIGEFNDSSRRDDYIVDPPLDTRALGRGRAIGAFIGRQVPYVINWDSIAVEGTAHVAMPDPFETYTSATEELLPI